MTSVIIFILGALFSLALVMAVLMMLSATMVPAGHKVTATAAPRHTPRHFAKVAPGRPAPSRPADARKPDPRIAIPARNTAADREAYRIAKSLEQAERALTKIANGREAAAAKIAQQTLRRLKDAKEPPKARLVFALARLELLSLRPEPFARAEASAALCAFI